MPISVSITGDASVKAALRALAMIAPDLLGKVVAESTMKIHAEARRNAPTDVGFLKSSIIFEIMPQGRYLTGEVQVNTKYGPYVEFGTRPHFPPIAPLEEWARRHGMPAGTGFLIARRIAQRGTPAQPFLFPAAEAERPNFERNAKNALIEAARAAKQ